MVIATPTRTPAIGSEISNAVVEFTHERPESSTRMSFLRIKPAQELLRNADFTVIKHTHTGLDYTSFTKCRSSFLAKFQFFCLHHHNLFCDSFHNDDFSFFKQRPDETVFKIKLSKRKSYEIRAKSTNSIHATPIRSNMFGLHNAPLTPSYSHSLHG